MAHPLKKATLAIFVVLGISACSSGDDQIPGIEIPLDSELPDSDDSVDTRSLAGNGCQNVVIIDEFAYAACGNGIEAVDLETLNRSFISQPADDITGDASQGVLFTQSGNTLQQFDLVDPLSPTSIAQVSTNFLAFSGISAANGVLAVSAGATGSNTEIYTYDSSTLDLVIASIPVVDNITGNPDVHVTATPKGAKAFYSQDLGAVANWGIQIVEFDTFGTIVDVPDVVVLTPGQFTGSFSVPFGPANFPLESEFLNDRLYTAHFAANGIEVIDTAAGNALSTITLGYEPTNIATDGTDLFVVSVDRSIVDVIDPTTELIFNSIDLPLVQPVGIAVSETHIAIADRSIGLVIVTR